MGEWKGRITMKNRKLILNNNKAEFEEQLKEEERLNALIVENLGKVKING